MRKIIHTHRTLDVHHGKPHPEPYLRAMEKSGYTVSESIVVENAPLGVRSAKAASLFTIALNTDPLDPFILREAGADLVFTGAQEFSGFFPNNQIMINHVYFSIPGIL